MEAIFQSASPARAEGLRIAADMYTYTAGSTGLNATMPPWVQEGGYQAWVEHLKDPAIRARVHKKMNTPTDEWENFNLAASPEGTFWLGSRTRS